MAIKEEIKTLLGTKRGDAELGAGLISIIVDYLVDAACIVDVKEVLVTEVRMHAVEAWETVKGGPLPAVHERALTKWVRGSAAVDVEGPSVNGTDGAFEDDLADSALFCVSAPAENDLKTLALDKSKQSLTGARILVLSCALELGRVATLGEVVGVVAYKSDPRLSELARKQKKAGVRTLSQILDGKAGLVRRELTQHFGSIIREYSEKGFIVEASSITQWWAETQALASDDSMMVDYIREYLRKYCGRGLPETVDVLIATRVAGSIGGQVSADSMKDALKMAKTAKDEAAELRSLVSSLKADLGRVKASVAGREDGVDRMGGGGKAAKMKCFLCGKKGHKAIDCPDKVKDDDEAEEDK